ncbi:MAG: hypothetical protein ACP5E3_13950 [Bacteroidales bacterium]
MHKFQFISPLVLISFLICLTACKKENPAVFIEEINYNQTPHFKITTPNGTYYLEKQSGGFSSFADKHGTDWVQYRKSDSVTVPGSAASDFRGIPNLVHRGEQGGIGHPGFNKCNTEQLNDSTLISISHSGNYELKYIFSEQNVSVEITRADPSRNYWFLYEGPIAGRFQPETHLIFTNEGFHEEKPAIAGGNYIKGNFEWICAGDQDYDQVLLIKHETPDSLIDVAMYMGASDKGNDSEDGMVVIGFGRDEKHMPLMKQATNLFILEFMDKDEFLERIDYLNL